MLTLLIWFKGVALCTKICIQCTCAGYEVCSRILRVHIWYPIKQSLCCHRRLGGRYHLDLLRWWCLVITPVPWQTKFLLQASRANFGWGFKNWTVYDTCLAWYHITSWLQCLQWPISWRWLQVTMLCQSFNLSEHHLAVCYNEQGMDLLVWQEAYSWRMTESVSAVRRSWWMIAFAIHPEWTMRCWMHGCGNQCNCVNVTFIAVDKWMDMAWLVECLPEGGAHCLDSL
jgi:hypothetical protein